MKTLGTKIDNNLADRFRNVCNDEGKTISEQLRDMIEEWCDVSEEEEPEITINDVNEKPKTIKGKIVEEIPQIFHGEILDDDNNVIGSF